MHTGSECGAGIDVEYHFFPVVRLDVLPGGDHKNIVDVELMEILLPVVDPVDILGLVDGHAAFTDVDEHAKLLQLILYTLQNRFHSGRLSRHLQTAVLLLLHEEAKVGYAVIRRSLGKNIHKHLLLLQCSQGNLVLDLRSLQTDIVECADNNIFRLCHCLDLKFHPLHNVLLSL